MDTKRETISVKINPDIWKEARKRAIDKGISYSQHLEELIKKDLEENKMKNNKSLKGGRKI